MKKKSRRQKNKTEKY